MQYRIEERVSSLISSQSHCEDANGLPSTFCSLLYGSSPSDQIVAHALTLGYSLRLSEYPLLLLVTEDVPTEVISMLMESKLFLEVRIVEYIRAHESLFKKDWFRDVFTKFHIFNLTDFERVIFLDLDMVIQDCHSMDKLFRVPFRYGALENSKNKDAGSMWLQHGEGMGHYCKLINAGLILVKPDADLFQLLLEDILRDSPDHVPGMTPEQFYLARVMGKHFHHISQKYNFEVQLHGGVPLTDLWETLGFAEIACFHFSGGNPLKRIAELNNREWGCQTEKRSIRDRWNCEVDPNVRKLANERAKKAFGLWSSNFSLACSERVRDISDGNSRLGCLLRYGHPNTDDEPLVKNFTVGDLIGEDDLVVRSDKYGLLVVSKKSFELRRLTALE